MSPPAENPDVLLRNSLASGRIHSAYLFSGAGERPRTAALEFARGIVCTDEESEPKPCGRCRSCTRSAPTRPEIQIDGEGKKGPFFRHIGQHADLYWLERGGQDTRVRIGQVRAIQGALRLATTEGGRRVAVVADAELLNVEAQNALLRLLEEPPPLTSIALVTNSATSLLATIRSRCVRVAFPAEVHPALRGDGIAEEVASMVERLDGIASLGLAELLDWAEEYRGSRVVAAAAVDEFLAISSAWLHDRTTQTIRENRRSVRAELDAYRVLSDCRRELTRRNTNPQMTAERGLFALRGAVHT